MSDNGATTTQGWSALSAKYKVGERVKFVDEDCVVSGVTETLTGRWRYNIERNGVCIAVGVTENMLDPADRAGRFMGLKMTIDKRALDAASDDLNTTLRPEFGVIDGMDTEAQQGAAARMKARIDSNLEDAGFEGMRVQIELQPARARLVKVGL